FINNTIGVSADFFPSDVSTPKRQDTMRPVFQQLTARKRWLLPALNFGTGYEYRSKKNGSFCAGFSYHRMLSTMAYSRFNYRYPISSTSFVRPLPGHYFSLDLKYFFPY